MEDRGRGLSNDGAAGHVTEWDPHHLGLLSPCGNIAEFKLSVERCDQGKTSEREDKLAIIHTRISTTGGA